MVLCVDVMERKEPVSNLRVLTIAVKRQSSKARETLAPTPPMYSPSLIKNTFLPSFS